ncbi:hypothetical protein H2199_007504 [Coniosporium tulheliwenetii]|uniref:Uncharacterized protein n=1 Tax=Coniosporium tulheliwenetii TaxID=3383036 RepID=A0ACC2YPN0_9PEZI|nr:hypothetical protein H2199_007504 [Cladosporium sp. JES 115]
MTRPKIPPDQRQRTAQACESCKRRKQKCNGLCPCNTCEKRHFTCIYNDRDATSPPTGPPLKKREIDDGTHAHSSGSQDQSDGSTSDTPTNGQAAISPALGQRTVSSFPRARLSFTGSEGAGYAARNALKREKLLKSAAEPNDAIEAAARSLQQFAAGTEERPNVAPVPQTNPSSGPEEEAEVYSQTRMLQDPTGRLLYVGDSASLSFLQLLRMMVESVSGPSNFTNDPMRHKIAESQLSVPHDARRTHLLPDKATAYVLADAFFINTHGLIQVFERQAFLLALETCYLDPLSTDPSWLCLLNLVFAIGLMLATPRLGTNESAVITKLRNEPTDRAEIFYLNAKSLNDPMTGFEDADFWSVQALLLMAIFMLAKSKRNTAFALLGMAVRSAYALGLHREETLVIFRPEEQAARRNLWRSLFVIDRFLSCSLGRPTAISEEDCSGDALRPSEPGDDSDTYGFNAALPANASFSQTGGYALEAAVRSCSVIGVILKRVYQQRKISTRLAQEIADVCKLWPKALAPTLHWRQAANASPSQEGCDLEFNRIRPGRNFARMEKFSEACVIASTHTIVLVQNAFEAGYLPRRNPGVIYFLFAGALVLLANEFAALYVNVAADQCIRNAIAVTAYCAELDPTAKRLLHILTAFRDVVQHQRERRSEQRQLQAGVISSLGHQHQPGFYSTPQQYDSIPTTTKFPQEHQHRQPAAAALAETVPRQPSSIYLNHSQGLTAKPIPPTGQQHVHHQQRSFEVPTTSDAFATSTAAVPLTSALHDPTLLSPSATVATPLPQANPSPSFAQDTGRPTLDRPSSLSNLLDLSALDSAFTRVPSLHSEDSSGQDEHIDFDALWAWPSNTPAVGSPRFAGVNGEVQEISDSTVPLFGVVDR